MAQPDATFMKAYDAVRNRHSAEGWLFASPQQITKEIYAEMRRLDLIRAEKLALRSGTRKKRTAADFVPLHADGVSQHNIRQIAQVLRAKVA